MLADKELTTVYKTEDGRAFHLYKRACLVCVFHATTDLKNNEYRGQSNLLVPAKFFFTRKPNSKQKQKLSPLKFSSFP